MFIVPDLDVQLASDGNIEAIKRAVFFLWYLFSEPNQLSGIWNLDEKLIEHVLRIVDSMASNNTLDIELSWMLPYYYTITYWYFERFKRLHNLFGVSLQNENLWQPEKANSLFSN